jgi:1,4-dihydroxy-2-naphthoate octaprenyltransferase
MTDETRSVLYLFGGVVVGTVAANLIMSTLATIRMVRETSAQKTPVPALENFVEAMLAFALYIFVLLSAQTLMDFWEAAR